MRTNLFSNFVLFIALPKLGCIKWISEPWSDIGHDCFNFSRIHSFTISCSSLVFSPWPPLTSLLPAQVSSREPAGIHLNTVPGKWAVSSRISSPVWKDLCNHANISPGQRGGTKSGTDFYFFQQLGFMLVLSDHISVTLFLRMRLL